MTKYGLGILPRQFTRAFLVLLTAWWMSGSTSFAAAVKSLQKINVAYSSISGNMAPLWVTQDKGFFRKHVLEVQAVLI